MPQGPDADLAPSVTARRSRHPPHLDPPWYARAEMSAVVSDKYRGTAEYVLVLGELVRAAQYRGLTTYQDIAHLVGLPQHGNYMAKEIGLLLGAISEDEADAGRPMLSAVAVNVKGDPGAGFFVLARRGADVLAR